MGAEIGLDAVTQIHVSENNRLFFGGLVLGADNNTDLDDFPLVQFTPNTNSYFSNMILSANSNFSIFLGRFDTQLLTSLADKETNESSWLMFPNPTAGDIFVLPGVDFNGQLEVYSIDGKLLYFTPLQLSADYKASINIPELPPGTYIFSFKENNFLVNEKIIILKK